MNDESKIKLDSDVTERYSQIAHEENMSLTALVNMLLRNIKIVERTTSIEIDHSAQKLKKKVVIQQSNWMKRY